MWSPEQAPKPKNYYWKTEERNGIRYNTLNYTKKDVVRKNNNNNSIENPINKDDTEEASKTCSCCRVLLDNCCTLLLIFIIFILIITLIFFIIRCYFLEETISDLRYFIKNSSKISENSEFQVSQSSTDKAATFFPG